MPRKSNDEMIKDLELKLAKARENAVTRVQSSIEKLEEKKAALIERREKLGVQIDAVNAEISSLKAETSTADEV